MNTNKRYFRVIFLATILLVFLVACQPGKTTAETPSPTQAPPTEAPSPTPQPPTGTPSPQPKLGVDIPLRIMPLGGSIVEGFCDRPSQCNSPDEIFTVEGTFYPCNFGANEANPNIEGFRGFLRDKLNAEKVNVNYVGSVEVIEGLAHEGHFAFTIDNLDYCVQNAGWLEQAQPDVILLLTGADDAAWGEKPAEMLASLETLLGHIYEKLPETTEVIIAQYPPTRDEEYGGWKPDTTINLKKILAEYNAGIPVVVEKLRADGKHVNYVNMDNVFQAKEEYDQRGFHPRAVAAERMAQAWLEKIMQILGKPVMVSASPTLQPTPTDAPTPPPKLHVDAPLRIMPLGDGMIEGICDKSSNCLHPDNMIFPHDGEGVASCRTNWNTLNPGERGFREFLRDQLVMAGVNMTYVGSVQVTEGLAHEGHHGFTLPDLDFCIQNAKWLENAKPDMILLFAGGVDIFYEDPPEVVLENLRGLLKHIYQVLPETTEVIIAQGSPAREEIHIAYDDPTKPLFNDLLKEYYTGIPGVVEEFRAEGKHVSSVDLWNTIQSPDEIPESGGGANLVAFERMAQIWFEKIMEILAQQP
jgi:lysophospholipase L1-like esterase